MELEQHLEWAKELTLEPALQFAIFALVFGALEWSFANRREQPRLRFQWLTDMGFYWGQHLLWLGVQLYLLVELATVVRPAAGLEHLLDGMPLWGQLALVVVIGDISTYWFHRVSHQWSFLWRFHQVHHSSPRLDWLAAHREHPVDGFLTQLSMNWPALFVGIELGPLAGFILFRGVWATFIHTNVRLPLPGLRVLVGAPELHHWHHLNVSETKHNFSNLAPWTDVLFGTYHCPEDQHFEVGLPEHPDKPYWRWIVDPFLPASLHANTHYEVEAEDEAGPEERLAESLVDA